MNKLILAFSLVITIASCSPKLSADNTWDRRRWILVELKGVPVQLGGGGRDAYIEFTPSTKRFAGNAGCNQISGTYTLDKRKLDFGDVISTKMSCPDISFETTFLSELSGVDRYETDGN